MAERSEHDQFSTSLGEGADPRLGSSTDRYSSDGRRWDVEMSVLPPHLAAIRNVMGTLAVHLDFDLDAVADLRLAADEVASQLVAVADSDTAIDCGFALRGGTLTMRARVRSPHPDGARSEGLGARILASLVDSVRYEATPDPHEPGDYLITTTISKRQAIR